MLFASIQTLGRQAHLKRFDPRRFDYIVVDEFHHAAAQSYRRVIAWFEPRFLLGLTATPERTDGGDLLTLCGDNLVYRCDVAEGIRRGLLCPFDYYGVPDEVDYTNIPWRSSHFDEEALTAAVATQARASNALEQYRRRAGKRAIAFCVSQRHADFMADFFRSNGLRAVAVHAGAASAPRAHSLERLAAGELDVVCAVDMFNEGVDLPNVDTILMLRPTESRILWLQQFGRGLRYLPEKTLQVIDYIGNHRIFLTKARALFDAANPDREAAFALTRLLDGQMELPPGCSVTYELEAKDILRKLIRPVPDDLKRYYLEFRDTHGGRPLVLEAYEDGFNPRTVRTEYGSWFEFVAAMGDLTPEQAAVRSHMGAFLGQLETTPMTKSYKMLVLLAMLGEGAFPGSIDIERLTERFADLARRYASIRQDIGETLDDPAALRRLIITNPIAAWTGGAGTGGVAYFAFDGQSLSTAFSLSPELRETAQDMVRELVDWRLTEYLRRTSNGRGADTFVARVNQASGRPIVFPLPRETVPGIPEGWVDLVADDSDYQANFVKAALNVVVRAGSEKNVLPDILRGWFGPLAGRPGRTDSVVFERSGSVYLMRPVKGEAVATAGPVLWQRYSRADAVQALGLKLSGWEQQSGILERPDRLVFFVTLDKGTMAAEYGYKDHFLSPTEFQWQSQNRNSQGSQLGQKILHSREEGVEVHLFVRDKAKVGQKTQEFRYAGQLEFLRWEGEKPITVWWRLGAAVPDRLWGELVVPSAET